MSGHETKNLKIGHRNCALEEVITRRNIGNELEVSGTKKMINKVQLKQTPKIDR
jgi:hypothetical protein